MLEEISADIVCLQEVPRNEWETDELFQSFLLKNQYAAIVQESKKDFHVACVTLYNITKFNVKQTESRSRALIVVLEAKQTSVSIISGSHQFVANLGNNDQFMANDANSNKTNIHPLFLVNCHLEAGGDGDEKRYYQIRSLLMRLETHVDHWYGNNRTSYDADPCIILAGDFNVASFYRGNYNPCSIYHLLSTGKLISSLKNNIISSKIDPALPFLPMHDIHYKSNATITNKTKSDSGNRITMNKNDAHDKNMTNSNRSYTTIKNESLAHKLIQNIKNRARTPTMKRSQQRVKNLVPRMTFASGAVLDYIWASSRFRIVPSDNRMDFYQNQPHSKGKQKNRFNNFTNNKSFNNNNNNNTSSTRKISLKGNATSIIQPWIINRRNAMKNTRCVWPNHENPSDHLPIGAIFALPHS